MESLVRFPVNTFGLRRKRLYQPRAAAQAATPLLGFRDKSGREALPQPFSAFQIGQTWFLLMSSAYTPPLV
jgi:hypothetical protein